MTNEEAVDVLTRNYPSSCFEGLCKAVDIAIKALSAQPEIVRCKDCKHRPTLDEDGDLDFPTCRCPCQCEDFYYSWMPKDDWYCADAERWEE